MSREPPCTCQGPVHGQQPDRTRKVPVIVVTSSQAENDVQRAYENGANSFVSKSDSPERTLQRLRLLPVYWLELNRLPERGPEVLLS